MVVSSTGPQVVPCRIYRAGRLTRTRSGYTHVLEPYVYVNVCVLRLTSSSSYPSPSATACARLLQQRAVPRLAHPRNNHAGSQRRKRNLNRRTGRAREEGVVGGRRDCGAATQRVCTYS
jgi:hypothetical protein